MSEIKKENPLSTEQVDIVLQFAQGLYSGFSGWGYYNPYTQNQNLIDLNNNPKKPTYESLLRALDNAVIEASTLQGYSEYMEIFDTIYKNTLRHFDDILAFDLSWECINVKEPKDYIGKEFKEDENRVFKFFDKFKYKQEFEKIVKELLRHEVCFTWFRDSYGTIKDDPINLDEEDNYLIKKKQKFTLQMMPQKYCLLSGYFNSNELLYDFDMNFFLKGTVDINLFDPSFNKKFKDIFADGTNNEYNPSAQLNSRNGEFATWVQTSPNDGAYAFKMNPSNFNLVPPFASLMKSVFKNTEIEQMQYNKDIASAYALLMGEIETFNNGKSGTQQNQTVLDSNTMGKFLSHVQSGLKENIRPIAMPLINTKFGQFVDNSPLMADYQLKQSSAQGASASQLIYSNGNMGQAMALNAMIDDYEYMAKLYSQFENFLDFFVNKKTKKYKFKFHLEGSIYPFEREYRRKKIMELSDRGITLSKSAWASAYGYEPSSFDRMMKEAKYGDFADDLFMLMNKNTMKDGNGVGAPNKSEGNISDNGATSQGYQ